MMPCKDGAATGKRTYAHEILDRQTCSDPARQRAVRRASLPASRPTPRGFSRVT